MAINTGEFEKIIITDAGRAMISGARDNNTITFTRIALGDGQIESPDDIFTLTKIKHECLSMPIVSKKDITDGQIRLEFRLNNNEIETGFTFREIGIMAHMADGIEQLYAYTYAKDPTQIYNKNTPIQERIIYADIVVGNSENINIILDLSNTYARMQDIADHNTDPTAHKTGIAGNAATSTKALQDTKGQQIDTTYIKSIAASNATITATKGNGETSSITINNVAHATNADNATKATNDSDGKAINATYIKKASGAGENLTLANDNFGGQLTIKRNSGNAATIKYTNTNNVNRYIGFTGSDKTMYKWGDNGDGQTAFLDASNYNNYAPTKTGGGASGTWNININGTSTNATNLVASGTTAYIKYGGGDVDENTAISQNKTNLVIGSWYSTGFRDLCSSGTPIRVAINHRNGNIKTTGNITASGAMYGATPGTGDNSTRIATTAFVKNNFIEILKKVYPVGAIYTSTVSTSPATLFGFGTWEQIQGRFLLGVSSSHGAGTTGGAETVTLTTAQLPAHNHSGSTGSAGSHNHSASSSNVNISGTFGTGNTTPNIFYKGDTSGCFYNTGNSGNDGTYQPHYTQDDRTQKVGINNTHSHTITVNSNGAHTHSVSIGNTGSGQAHTNMPPYIAVYIWKRKA